MRDGNEGQNKGGGEEEKAGDGKVALRIKFGELWESRRILFTSWQVAGKKWGTQTDLWRGEKIQRLSYGGRKPFWDGSTLSASIIHIAL